MKTKNKILKFLILALPLATIIFLLGGYFLNFENTPCLEVETEGEFDLKEYTSSPNVVEITDFYNVDEYIRKWDGQVEGFNYMHPYIEKPTYYFSGNSAEISETWKLRNGYELKLSCLDKKIDEVVPGDFDICSVIYNGNVLSDDVRYYISPPNEEMSTYGNVSLVVYSPYSYEDENMQEYVVIGSYSSGSYDDLSVFSLNDGSFVQIPFIQDGESKDAEMVSHNISFRLIRNSSYELKLVTHLHNPAMGSVNIYKIWNLEGDSWGLEKTIGDIVE